MIFETSFSLLDQFSAAQLAYVDVALHILIVCLRVFSTKVTNSELECTRAETEFMLAEKVQNVPS